MGDNMYKLMWRARDGFARVVSEVGEVPVIPVFTQVTSFPDLRIILLHFIPSITFSHRMCAKRTKPSIMASPNLSGFGFMTRGRSGVSVSCPSKESLKGSP